MADIILDLPAAPSVNRTRKIDWKGLRAVRVWAAEADRLVLSQGRLRNHVGPFELHVTLAEGSAMDMDNGLKSLIDYLRRIEVIEGDGPRHMRRLTVEFGHAPAGCRVRVAPIVRCVEASA